MHEKFIHFKKFSHFILQNHLPEVIKNAINRAQKSDLGFYKLLSKYSQQEIYIIFQNGIEDQVLRPVLEGRPFDRIIQKIEAWKANSTIIPKNSLDVEDITSLHNVRKDALLDFLKFYEVSRAETIELMQEINQFFNQCIDFGLKAYKEINHEVQQEKSELLEGLLTNLPLIVTKFDNEGKILFSAGAGLKSLGLKNNELEGTNIHDDNMNSEFTQDILKGSKTSVIGTSVSSEGEIREFENFYVPHKNGTLGFSIDITRQRDAEGSFFNLVEGVKDYAIFMLHPDGTIASWNEGAKAFKGYTKEEILGKHFSIFYPKEKIKSKFPEYELEQAAKHGRFEDEGIRVRKDGTTFWANVVLTAIYNDKKELTGFTKITRDLTERKKAEEKLRQSEERFRNIIEGVKDYAIFMLNPDGTVASWNEGAKVFKGYEKEEIIGKHFSIFYPQEKKDIKFPEYELEQAKKLGRFEDEGIRVRKDGSTFWANVIITAIYNDEKELIGFTKITRDLSERKLAEEALKQSESRFRNLVEGVKDYAIFMLNPDGTIASWNAGAKAFKGYERGEVIGKHFQMFYPKEKRDINFPEYELEQATKFGRFEDEGPRIRKDGSTFWANVVITAIYNEKKELLGFTKITRDLTERREAEEKLRRSEERYRLLIEAVKDYAIFIINPEGTIVSWNEGAKRLKGYNEEEVIGKNISIFYTEDKIKSKYPQYELAEAKKNGRFEDEGLRVRKDGTTFFANVIITALYDTNKNLIGFSKITRDLTERRKYEQSLLKLNSELEEKVTLRTAELETRTQELESTIGELKKINNDLDNFIYTASHDLKAPISNLEGLIYGLYEELETYENPSLETFKGLIEISIKRFQSTIQDLTEIAKIQKDSMDLTEEEIDLENLVEDVKINIHEQIQKSGARIVLNLPCRKIRFTKKNLKSIVYNLISNGIKYRNPGRTPVVKVSCDLLQNMYVLAIEDNGLGLKEENLPKMFTMFRRFHDHVEGSGIGLYIVKRIIENANGKIEVTSQEGVGTTFKIFIPQT